MTGMGGFAWVMGCHTCMVQNHGEADIGLRAFLVSANATSNTIDVEVDIDWGMHCNADALAEQAAIIANRMGKGWD